MKFHPETGQMIISGTDPGESKVASARFIYDVFNGSDGERLMSDIAQDCLNRGQRVPIAIKAMRSVKDKETRETTKALDNIEYLRRKRLQTDKMAGRISEAEYQTELKKGSVV